VAGFQARVGHVEGVAHRITVLHTEVGKTDTFAKEGGACAASRVALGTRNNAGRRSSPRAPEPESREVKTFITAGTSERYR